MIMYDFEDGLFPSDFKNSTSHPWVNTTDDSNGGTHCLKSGNLNVGRTTSAFYIIGDFKSGNFICDYRISSEQDYDFGYIIVDGVAIVDLQSGDGSWVTMPAYNLSAGIHTIQFIYVKDNSTNSNSDSFFIDNITLPDFTNIANKVDFFDTGVPSGWVNDPAKPWKAGSKMQTPFAGIESADILDNESSTIKYISSQNSKSGKVFFFGCADSEAGDQLKFYIDGVEVYSDEGRFYDSPNRPPKGYFGSVSTGSHEYKWAYSKNSSGALASDTGYVWGFYEPGEEEVSNNDLFDISDGYKTAAKSEVTTPVYLVEISLKRTDGIYINIRLSSSGKRTFDGKDFGNSPYPSAEVKDITSQKTTISMDNSGQLYSFFSFSDDIPLKEQRVRVWQSYDINENIDAGNTILQFDGYINDILEISEAKISFNCLSQSVTSSWCPRIRLLPPLCNHLPKSGTKIGNLLLEPGR